MSNVKVLYSHVPYHNDSIIVKKRRMKKGRRNEGCIKTSFQIYLPLTLLQGFERVV